MVMLVCAYSCVIDAINAAVVNAEVRAPMCGSWDVQAQPDRRFGTAIFRADNEIEWAQIALLFAPCGLGWHPR